MNNEELKKYLSEGGVHEAYIDMNEIHADVDFNCRGKIIPMDVKDLAMAMDRDGQLQAVMVRLYDDAIIENTGKKYGLVAGFRRHMAAIVNQWVQLRATILPSGLTEEDARFINLNENLQRKDLDFMQEAEAINKIMGGLNITEKAVMSRLGQSRGWVQTRMMALKMPKEVQLEIKAGFITQEELRSLYTIKIKEGNEALFSAVRELKDDKLLGRKSKAVNSTLKKADSKKIRKRPEMFEMQEHIQGMFGNGFVTRMLAWCAGEITNQDIDETIKINAEKSGLNYKAMELN